MRGRASSRNDYAIISESYIVRNFYYMNYAKEIHIGKQLMRTALEHRKHVRF